MRWSERSAWSRWKALSRRAAHVQSNVLLWLLYYGRFVPMALVRHVTGSRPFRAGQGRPAWEQRAARPADLPSARRQF